MPKPITNLSLWTRAAWVHVLIAASVVTFVALISVFTGRYLMREMEKIETVAMARDVNRLRLGLNYEAWSLDTTCRDWATWQEFHRFASDRNEAFIAENLYDSALHDTLDLDLFALFDRTGNLVWGRRWLPGAEPDGDVEAMLLGPTGVNPFLVDTNEALGQGRAGIRLTPAGPMVLAVRPLRAGTQESSPAGMLFMGRLLHARRTAWLGQRTGLTLRLYDSRRDVFSSRETALLRDLDRAPFAVEAREQDATIYLRVPDVTGEGFLLASIVWPREQVARGRNAATTVMFSLFVAILLMLLALGAMLRTHARVLEQSRQELMREVQERTADLAQSRQEALALLEDANQQRARSERALAKQKSTAEALRKSEDRYRSLFEGSRDAMVLYNTTAGVFTACNTAAQKLFGAARMEDLLSQSPGSLSPPEQSDGRSSRELADSMTDLAIREGSHAFEWDFRKLTGGVFTSSVTLSRFEAEGLYLQATVRDITAQKRLEAERERARDAAEAANRAKSTFLANMSHEIRTPLNVILGYAQLLQRDPELTLQQRESIGLIARSGEHLLRMLSDILEMSRIEAGSLVRRENLFDFHELLHALEKTYRLRAAGKNLAFHWDAASDLPRLLRGDDNKIRQALDNLLDNAMIYTDRGSVSVRIRLAAAGAPCRLAVDVEDTGRGIAPADQALLFEPFGPASRPVGVNEGSGLGLAISRTFARLMGGDVTVTSEPGRGSVFRLLFEANPAGPDEESSGGGPGPDPRQVLGLAVDQRARRILVAEDNAAGRQMLARLLESSGFEVRQAADGKEALALFETEAPDAVLMDRRMPELDGLEALRLMKAARPGTPVLIVTGGGLGDDRAEALAAGADGYLSKPYRESELFDAIRRVTGVTYRYAESAPAAAAPAPVPGADAAAFRALPEEWRDALRLAAGTGDIERLGELADQACGVDPALGARLRVLVEAFDYEGILKLLV